MRVARSGYGRTGLRWHCSPLESLCLVRGECRLLNEWNDPNVICDRFVGRSLRSDSKQHVCFFTLGVCFQVVVLMTRFGIKNVTSRILQSENVLWSV